MTLKYTNLLNKKLYFYVISLFLLGSLKAFAVNTEQHYELDVMPTKCLIVKEGKDCYVSVIIKWKAFKNDDYCIFSSLSNKAIRCWSAVNSAEMKQELITKKNVLFSLQRKNSTNTLISKEMKVAWVYKKNSRAYTTWRMF